jgi:Tfp pilus assembly protein PilZ
MEEKRQISSDEVDKNFAERRQTDRKKLIVDVHFEGGDATGIANTTDISTGGLFLKTNALLEVGKPIAMRLTFSGKSLILDGIVAYADRGKGFGISFQNLDEEKSAVLKRELNLQ